MLTLYNIKCPDEQVDFKEAVMRGIAKEGGLFFPTKLPFFADMESLLKQTFIPRCHTILDKLLDGSLSSSTIQSIVTEAFNFPLKIHQVEERIFALELFYGPTLAFKDFGARFMAHTLAQLTQKPLTIVTATSGDTGAAVAHAFYDIPHVNVVILYPRGKISELQEKLFCTLGKNIHTFAVEGDFDDCQSLVKQCFADPGLGVALNSANSINISRIFAQSLYYFEALSQVKAQQPLVVSVPSGNFGNLTAGLLSKAMGLPIKRFVAATNANDTVPRYLQSGRWHPEPTRATLSNAMDVSRPNNWPRIEELVKQQNWQWNDALTGIAFDDKQTQKAMSDLHHKGYIAEPHSAIAYAGLRAQLKPGERGVFLCTAHPAKFKSIVDHVLRVETPLPQAVRDTIDKPLLSKVISNDYSLLADLIRAIA